MSKRALLLLNRFSRNGRASANAAVECLKRNGFDLLETSPVRGESLSQVVLRHRGEVDLVIVGGGDGTLNAAADGLVEAGLPLGILPLGTANDLARTLGLPLDLEEACRVVAAGRTREIDLGQVNGKHYFNVASVGLSVEITRRMTKETKSVWGVFAYLITAMRVVWGSRPFRAEIRSGDTVHSVRTIQISVGNGRHYGGGMTVAEDALIDDQQLDLYSVEIDAWWKILWVLPLFKSGALEVSPYVRTLRGTSFDVVPRAAKRVNTDGEITERTPATFRVVSKALKVFVSDPQSAPGLSD